MLESKFQSSLIKEIKKILPGSIVMKGDANYIQGFPDLIVFYKDKWATLECKKDEKAKHRPNQDYWVETLGKMSFSAFIHPANKEEVLNDLVGSLQRDA